MGREGKNNDVRILDKTPFKTKRTFIALGIEKLDELNTLCAAGHKHIFLTPRDNVPDMKAVKDTQKIFQMVPVCIDNKPQLIASNLPCSCSKCWENPTNYMSCEYYHERNIKIHKVKEKVSKEEEIQDIHGFRSLTIEELQVRCHAFGLDHSEDKEELVDILDEYEDCAREYFDNNLEMDMSSTLGIT